jgi:hypothetical protein
MLTLEEYTKECGKRPADYGEWGEYTFENGWGMTSFGVHRDSGSLDRSNWSVITDDLLARYPDDFAIIRAGHWAVGWYDHFRVNLASQPAIEAAYEWYCKLEDYPVACEEHFSNTEWEDFEQEWDSYGRDEIKQLVRAKRLPWRKQEETYRRAFIFMRNDGYDYPPSEFSEYLTRYVSEVAA